MQQRQLHVVAMLVAVAVIGPLAITPAKAAAAPYCGYALGEYGTCLGPYGALSKNAAIAQKSTWATCAGAQTSAGVFYGQYFCASNWSCHTYGGGNLTPLAHSHEAFGQTVYGVTNGDVGSLACPRGGPLSIHSTARTTPEAAVSLSATGSASGVRVGSFRADGKRCLSVADGAAGEGVTCAQSATAEAQDLVGVMRAGADVTGAEIPGSAALYALPPANATTAIVRRTDGPLRRLSVKNGVLVVPLAGDETTIQWDTPTAQLPIP